MFGVCVLLLNDMEVFVYGVVSLVDDIFFCMGNVLIDGVKVIMVFGIGFGVVVIVWYDWVLVIVGMEVGYVFFFLIDVISVVFIIDFEVDGK